jgi:two-component system, response regulator PdtaR
MCSATVSRPRPIVLVVEDDELQRMLATTMLEEAGYDAVEADSADEAITILEARKDIRIVFTDIEMPGSMNGLKLARATRDCWPPIELILTSGQYQLGASDLPARGHFLMKPYKFDELVEVLRGFTS